MRKVPVARTTGTFFMTPAFGARATLICRVYDLMFVGEIIWLKIEGGTEKVSVSAATDTFSTAPHF